MHRYRIVEFTDYEGDRHFCIQRKHWYGWSRVGFPYPVIQEAKEHYIALTTPDKKRVVWPPELESTSY